MIWVEALEIVIERTRHERYRWLTSDENPDTWQRDAYRRIVIEMATGEPAAPRPFRYEPLVVSEAVAAPTSAVKRTCCGGYDPMAL
jgi:hypothetical protein